MRLDVWYQLIDFKHVFILSTDDARVFVWCLWWWLWIELQFPLLRFFLYIIHIPFTILESNPPSINSGCLNTNHIILNLFNCFISSSCQWFSLFSAHCSPHFQFFNGAHIYFLVWSVWIQHYSVFLTQILHLFNLLFRWIMWFYLH